MKTTDVRDMTWEEIRDRVHGAREEAWQWLHVHGPATTSEMAVGLGWSLFNIRPRVCELAQLGFVECTGRSGREGVYRALSIQEVQTRAMVTGYDEQLSLKL